MSEPQEGPEYRLADWAIRISGEGVFTVYSESTGEDLATVHGDYAVAMRRALLMARAPSLLAVARAAYEVFSVMAEHGNDRERAVGLDMLPSLEAALYNLENGPETA